MKKARRGKREEMEKFWYRLGKTQILRKMDFHDTHDFDFDYNIKQKTCQNNVRFQ